MRSLKHRGAGAVTCMLAVTVIAGVADASSVQVQNGVLSIVQQPAEQSSVRIIHSVAEGTDAFRFDLPLEFPVRYRLDHHKWPGALPAIGAGCSLQSDQYGRHTNQCPDVTRIDIAFGSGDDAGEIASIAPDAALASPVVLSGGEGRDSLVVGDLDAEVDAGPGDDAVALLRGRASGGEGDDIFYVGGSPSGDVAASGPVSIDCGPGDDTIRLMPGFKRDVHAAAAACPPIVTPLVQRGPRSDGNPTVFYVPPSGKVAEPVFRASEAVSGTATLRDTTRHRACAAPVHFSGASNQRITPVFRLHRWVAKAVAPLPGTRGVPCFLRFTGKDTQGEPFDSSENPGWERPGLNFARFLFVSRRAANGRLPGHPAPNPPTGGKG